MKKFIRIPYDEESSFSYSELKERLNGILAEQAELSLYKLKGSPLYLLEEEKNETDQYTLTYHHSYKKDMCDTCVRFYIEKGLERSRIKGFFCKPKSSWAVFWGVIGSLFIDFLIISYCLLFTANFDLTNALMISFTAMIVRAYICLSVLRFNTRRLEEVKLKLAEIAGVKTNESENSGNEDDTHERN